MRAGDIISSHNRVVEADSTARECLKMMTERGVDDMVVVNDGSYGGIITQQHCTSNNDDVKVGEIASPLPAVQAQAHLLEAVELFVEQVYSQLAVVDPANRYVGSITSADIIRAISTICNTSHPGAVIEVEMLPEDYSVAEIARLIEDNHCKLITLFSYPDNDTGMLRVQIRTNCEDATAILQSLERYGYRVAATYYPQGRIDHRAEQRLRELMYYLEM